jgi:glutamate racemase
MIGIFDSGFGGLTVLKELLEKLPQYDYMYLGDNARTPYGSKSQAVIYSYTRQAVDFLFKQGCELIIIACNTSSAKALRKIQQEYLPATYPKRRVLGVIIPAAEAALEALSDIKTKKPLHIGIIGTRATIEARVYEQELGKLNKDLEIYSQPCPLLVPLVEEGWTRKPETRMILKKYLRPLKNKKINILILGCTHYPLLLADIKRIAGKSTKVINTPQAVAQKLKDYLARHPAIEKKIKKQQQRLFYTTDEPARFKNLGTKFLGHPILKAEKVEL